MQLLFTIIDYLINEAINDNYNDFSVKKFIMQSSEYIKALKVSCWQKCERTVFNRIIKSLVFLSEFF